MAVFSLSILTVILGVFSYIDIPRESTPDIKIPYITINTTYVGVSANDIESLITDPIENELEGIDGLIELTSKSRQNYSSILAKFSSSMSTEESLRRTKDRVDIAVAQLPSDTNEPVVKEISVSDWPIFRVVFTHPDGIGVINDAVEDFQDELRRLPGVLDVEIAGNPTQEVAIEIDPYRMAAYGFSVDDVKDSIKREHSTIPGGILSNQEKNYTIAVTGEITEVNRFGDIIVSSSNGVRMPLHEIAHVALQERKSDTLSRLNGIPAITLSIKRRTGENILNITDAARTSVDEVTPTLPIGANVYISTDNSEDIRAMLMDLENNMVAGFILVLLVTFLFLGFRTSLFVSMAIPLSMLLSFILLNLVGITLSMVVLFSLIIALGMLVDNGIVIVENISRHQMLGKSRIQAAIDGTREVAAPVATSTLTTILAFLPIIFMPGEMGQFMQYIPKTVIIVLTSSLFVALVINPAYCASFLALRKNAKNGNTLFFRVQDLYSRLLRITTKHGIKTISVITIISLSGFLVYKLIALPSIFFPETDPNYALIDIETPQGTPIEQTDVIIRQVEEMIPGIKAPMASYTADTGVNGESNMGRIAVKFVPYTEREMLGETGVNNLRDMLTPAVTGAIVTVEANSSGPDSGDDISYEISGEDFQIIGDITDKMMAVITPYEEVFKTIENDYEASLPEIAVNINRQQAAHYGLNTKQIANTIRTAVTGSKIGSFRHGNKEYDITVRYRDDARDSLQMLRNINIVSRDKRRIPLSAVATIEPKSSISVIKRRNLNRAVSISANFRSGINERSRITNAIKTEVATLKEDIPQGYSISTGSGSNVRQESTNFLQQAFLVAIFLIFIVLITQFNSLMDPFIIIYAVFLSLGGVMWGFALFRQEFVVIMSGVGAIALVGVAVNNCIVLVDYTHRMIRNGEPWREALILAGRTRLKPVMLTALTTVLALIPMAVGVSFDVRTLRFLVGSESSEYWKAFSWTLLHGLTFATITTLVVVPSLLSVKYRILERRRGLAAIQ